MEKKILVSIIAMAVLFLIGVSAYATAYVNNEDVSNEVFTTISNDYTLFPVRYLGEKLDKVMAIKNKVHISEWSKELPSYCKKV